MDFNPQVFSDALIRYREKKNMSQQNLAELTGVSQPHISDLEKGIHEPKLITVVKLAKGLDISIDELLADFVIVPNPSLTKVKANFIGKIRGSSLKRLKMFNKILDNYLNKKADQ